MPPGFAEAAVTLGSLADSICFLCDLGIVDSAAETLCASRFLEVFQALLLLFQFRLHAFNLIPLLFLALIPLYAVGNAVCPQRSG
jgi:hypothetical protein